MAQPTLNEIVKAFYEAPEIHFAGSSFCPAQDLVWCKNDQSLYLFSSGVWSPIPDTDAKNGSMARLIDSFLEASFPKISPSTQKITEVKECIFRRVPRVIEGSSPARFLVLEDQTIDLNDPSFPFLPHSRIHYATHKFDFPSRSLQMPTPVFDAYLERCFPDDPLERQLIWELLAFYILPHDQEPAFFYVYGPPRTGKSRLMHLIRSFMRPEYVASFSLQSLTTRQEFVAELVGKRLNILDEEESERVFSDKFKTLLDHDYVEARRLYQPAFSFKPFTKFLFASNQLPNFRYAEGLERRLHIVHFKNPIPVEDQDKDLDAKLLAEVPGIVGKALHAAKALVAKNFEFVTPASSVEAQADFLRSVMPSRLFLEEWCEIIPYQGSVISDSWATHEAIYNSYTQWCRLSGHKPLSSQNFHRQLHSAPGIVSGKSRGIRRKNLKLVQPYSGDAPVIPFNL